MTVGCVTVHRGRTRLYACDSVWLWGVSLSTGVGHVCMFVTVCHRGIICTPEAGPGHVCMFMTACGIVFPPKGSGQHFLPQQEHQRHQAVANALCQALGGAGALRPSPPQGLGRGIVCAPTRPKTARVGMRGSSPRCDCVPWAAAPMPVASRPAPG